MSELNHKVSEHFSKNSLNNIKSIIVSGSNKVGEGEHKLFNYIRTNPLKHSNETTVIYGLDADLIMLSVNVLPICPNIYLFRETPHFIQSIDNTLEPDSNYFLDIPEFTHVLARHMNGDEDVSPEKQKQSVYDYIFICFFLGNDFLPHFPSLNIRTGGVDKMLNVYKKFIGAQKLILTDGERIYWKNVRTLVYELSKLEEDFFIKEHRSRNNKERRGMANTEPEEKIKKFESTPIYNREIEHFINPLKPRWQQRYYKGLFGIKEDTNGSQRNNISINYLEGLEWTMKYYTKGCPDWRWKYKYNYPPLLQDLLHSIPLEDNYEFISTKNANPVTELVQLCYVLPRVSLNLLPNNIYFELMRKYDHWYKGDCDFIWAYCRYFWESHVVMNEIDINELERFCDNFTNKKESQNLKN